MKHLQASNHGIDSSHPSCVFHCSIMCMPHALLTCDVTSAAESAQLVVEHVVKLHGVPGLVVSDRGPQFKKFWAKVHLAKTFIPQHGCKADLSAIDQAVS